MAKYKFFVLFLCLFLISLFFIFKIRQKPFDLEQNVKEITQNLKVIDVNDDHNQALDVMNYAKSIGVGSPKVLITFDTHSDIFWNSAIIEKNDAQIYNWVNVFLAQNPDVNEVYWVMPEEVGSNQVMMYTFWENKEQSLVSAVPMYGNCNKKFDLIRWLFVPVSKAMYVQDMRLEPVAAVMNEYVPNHKFNKLLFSKEKTYRKIKVITCTAKSLPDFTNKKVFLSIDADYISNSGYDTLNDLKFLKTSKQMDKSLNNLVETINKKNIRPEIISFSMSPQYLPKNQYSKVRKFFENIEKFSGKKDALEKYHYKYTDYEKKN
jgi:hypothetical protein